MIEMENADGECVEAAAPEVLRDRSAARERVLADPAHKRLPDEELMESHVRPAIERLQQQAQDGARVKHAWSSSAPRPRSRTSRS